jgi:aminopeptidase-like protein
MATRAQSSGSTGIHDLLSRFDARKEGAAMHALMARLYPVCRSITGDGFRRTLAELGKHIPLAVEEVPSGTRVFDWTVPKEWNIRDAYIRNSRGEKVVDFKQHTLHVLNYSVPVAATMSLAELQPHLYSLPDNPDVIPYRTSYYSERWGFCLPHRLREQLPEGEYEVVVDSSLADGHLTYGELLLRGEEEGEFLVSTHACHPSLCNDNLSGVVLAAALAGLLGGVRRRYSYRFLFIPGTIGSITWLSKNAAAVSRIKHGLVVACVGDRGAMTYKKSRRGDAEIDRAVLHVLKACGEPYRVKEFSPYGYDERQYCSPGFDLAVGSLTRTPHGEFPEYHTSADNLEFVRPEWLADSLRRYLEVVRLLEGNRTYLNTNPRCEPQLGRRGLYSSLGGNVRAQEMEMALLWILNLSDGSHSLLDIAERSGLGFVDCESAAALLVEHGLLVPAKKGA